MASPRSSKWRRNWRQENLSMTSCPGESTFFLPLPPPLFPSFFLLLFSPLLSFLFSFFLCSFFLSSLSVVLSAFLSFLPVDKTLPRPGECDGQPVCHATLIIHSSWSHKGGGGGGGTGGTRHMTGYAPVSHPTSKTASKGCVFQTYGVVDVFL